MSLRERGRTITRWVEELEPIRECEASVKVSSLDPMLSFLDLVTDEIEFRLEWKLLDNKFLSLYIQKLMQFKIR
jgi:hypothetical protein